jgi:flavin-dependent dehydrogenase
MISCTHETHTLLRHYSSLPQVALLDKEHFPRDKYCGDAVCTPAIRILEDMGVLKELVDNNEAHFADAGGFVSPDGTSYIGASKQKLGQAACCAVKRINLDVRIARCAQRSGATLTEGFEVVSAEFDKAAGLWTVTSAKGDKVKGRALVIADGATSKLATKLGYCTEPPKGVCSRAFVEGGTHNTNFDGVCFYPKWSLPGYAAIFRCGIIHLVDLVGGLSQSKGRACRGCKDLALRRPCPGNPPLKQAPQR